MRIDSLGNRLFFLCSTGFLLLSGLAWDAAAATTITSDPAGPFGIANVVDSGQVFRVPTDGNSYFANFTCAMGGAGGSIKFIAALYPFDAVSLTVSGPAVYTSSVTQVSQVLPYTSESFTPNSPIPLIAATSYIFTFQQGGFGNPGNLQWEYSDNYAGGEYLATYGSAPYTGASWIIDSHDPGLDIGFSATFVPEPACTALAAVAVGTLISRRKRRSSRNGRNNHAT